MIAPLRSYRKLLDPPTDRWPVFPTFDQRTLATLVEQELADRGLHADRIAERRAAHARDLTARSGNRYPPTLAYTERVARETDGNAVERITAGIGVLNASNSISRPSGLGGCSHDRRRPRPRRRGAN